MRPARLSPELLFVVGGGSACIGVDALRHAGTAGCLSGFLRKIVIHEIVVRVVVALFLETKRLGKVRTVPIEGQNLCCRSFDCPTPIFFSLYFDCVMCSTG